jgi:hypothetical protein
MTDMVPEGEHRERAEPAEVTDLEQGRRLRDGEVDEVTAPVPPGSDPDDYDRRSLTDYL